MCLLGQLDPNLDRPATSRTGELTRSVVIRFLTLSVLYLYMIRLLFFSLKKVFLCKKRVVDWDGLYHVLGLEKKWEKLPFSTGRTPEGCDFFSGRWVWDDSNRPLYEESECPYIQPQLTCQEHGRPEKDYQHWRWQPHGCDLPR